MGEELILQSGCWAWACVTEGFLSGEEGPWAEGAEDEESRDMGLSSVLREPNLRGKALTLAVCYSAVHVVYNSLQFNSVEHLPGDPFLVFALGALVDVPSVLLNVVVVEWAGRVRVACGCFLSGGAACILCVVLGLRAGLLVGLALLGKCLLAAAYITVMQLTSEEFPTVARGAGVGFVSLLSHGAYLVMPLLRESAEWHPGLPLLLSGSLSLAAAVACVFLPETKFRPLPQTLEEAREIGSVGWTALLSNLSCCSFFQAFRRRKYGAEHRELQSQTTNSCTTCTTDEKLRNHVCVN